jgi:hypothetical protein
MTEREVFLQALDITKPAERAAFLDRACADQPSLRAQVDQLLQAHEQAGQRSLLNMAEVPILLGTFQRLM